MRSSRTATSRLGRLPGSIPLLVPLLAAVAVAAGCVAPVPPPPPPGEGAPTLEVSVVVDGLAKPWDIGFLPDGSMVFTERSGPISALVGGEVRRLADPPDVDGLGEGGMLGLAVDPDYASNRHLYTCFLSNADGPHDVRVVRWTVDAATTTIVDRVDLLTGLPVNTSQVGRHSGCRPRFGPDGYLWVTAGDAATATNPQDPTSLGGKVLRIDRDGAPAPGNPGAPFRPEVYTYGHRNPQGLAFRPSDGTPFSVEHGPDCNDEVNILVPGGNYGWNPIATDGSGSYNELVPMTDLDEFPDAVPAVWSSGCPTIATSGAGFVVGEQWAAWDGALIMAALKGEQLRVLQLDEAGAVVGEGAALTDQGRLRQPVQGPDGDLYVAQDANPGAILRVHPV